MRAEDNLYRELLEEYGVTPKNIKFLGYRDALRQLEDNTKTHWIALDYLVEVDRDKLHIAEPDMFVDSGWFKPNDLPEPLHSQLPYALKKYCSEFDALNSSDTSIIPCQIDSVDTQQVDNI